MDLRRYKNVARKMGESLAENAAKVTKKAAAYTGKAADYAEKAAGQFRQWKTRVNTRSKYVSTYANSDATKGGAAGAVHAFLTKPKNRRLLIVDGVLAIILVASLIYVGWRVWCAFRISRHSAPACPGCPLSGVCGKSK